MRNDNTDNLSDRNRKAFGYPQPVPVLQQVPTADRRLRIPSHHLYNFQEQIPCGTATMSIGETKTLAQTSLFGEFGAWDSAASTMMLSEVTVVAADRCVSTDS